VSAVAIMRTETLRTRVLDYVALTKPRIMSLLLVTATAGAFGAARGFPRFGTVVGVLVGGALASGGASTLNHVLDRDLDARMRRTHDRPVASERIPAEAAMAFGIALSAMSFVVFVVTTNLLAALLALAGNAFYVAVYTGWLKRSTPQNIVIGGAAGAVPPLVGWAAVSGNVGAPALWLFAIVFLWTPPHFWALAMLLKDDYAAVGVPMLPVVRGERVTVRRIFGYAGVLSIVTMLPIGWRSFGLVYGLSAASLDVWLLHLAWRLFRDPSRRRARALFHSSLLYLAGIFVAVALGAGVQR
jgi:protoheme IX farnesyltransferase